MPCSVKKNHQIAIEVLETSNIKEKSKNNRIVPSVIHCNWEHCQEESSDAACSFDKESSTLYTYNESVQLKKKISLA